MGHLTSGLAMRPGSEGGIPHLSAGARAAAFAFLACACAWGASPAPTPLRAEREVMGVTMAVELRDPEPRRARAAAERALAAAERTARLLLAQPEGSEVRLLNDVPSRVAIEVSPQTADALRRALAIAAETDGAFDPTSPPLARLWGLESGEARVPRGFEIQMALRQVDWSDVEVDEERPVVQRLSRRTRIDLDGFAVGACADAAATALREAGVPAAHASAGGAHVFYGGSDRRPWRLAVGAESGGPVAELALQRGAWAEARPRRVLRAADGTAVHDLLDPREGRPASGARWVAVTAGDAATAAAFARATFVMGADGPAFLERRESLGGLGVLATGERWATEGLDVRWEKGGSSSR
jgi:thiamine biosynthesis lipoprotein